MSCFGLQSIVNKNAFHHFHHSLNDCKKEICVDFEKTLNSIVDQYQKTVYLLGTCGGSSEESFTMVSCDTKVKS